MSESMSKDAISTNSDATSTNSLTVKEESAPKMPERAKDEFEGVVHPLKSHCHHSKEKHQGLQNNITADTSPDEVRAPNVFERAKEELQAIAQVFHHKKDAPTPDTSDGNQISESKHEHQILSSPSESNAKEANIFVRAKKEIKAMIHHDKSQHRHRKETHGKSDDIDDNTPTNEVKGPNVFERVKEEFEAVFQAIHPKKEG